MRTAILLTIAVLAHPGGLDSSGGHHDRKNGGYHYHRGGGGNSEAPLFVPQPIVRSQPRRTIKDLARTIARTEPRTTAPAGRQIASSDDAGTPDEYRTFTSKAGTTIRAAFVAFHANTPRGSRVILRKEAGGELDVAMNDLIADDQDWIRAEVKRRRH